LNNKKAKKKYVKTLLILAISCASFVAIYEFYLRYEISDYFKEKITYKLGENFQEKNAYFKEIQSLQNSIKNIENLTFYKNDTLISFTINSDSLPKKYNNHFYFSNEDLSDITFLKNDSLQVVFNNETLKIGAPWTIRFEGTKTDVLYHKLLQWKNISAESITQVLQILSKIDCETFTKTKDRLEVRYAGHSGENYSYVFSKNTIPTNSYWTPLTHNWYSVYHRFGLFCGWTDWSIVYFYKFVW